MSEVNKIRILGKDYPIKTRRRVGVNQVTNLSGIPVDREKIIATLSGESDFSFSEPLTPGDLLEIICTADEGAEKFVQDFTGPGITTNFDDLTMISSGKIVIARVYCYDEGKYYIVGEGTEKAVFKYNTGDIIVYDNKIKRLIPISPEVHNFIDYPTSRYSPIGVVVIPNSHDVYKNGSAGVVCLNPMSTLTPDVGASDGNDIEEMCWGNSTNIENLPETNVFNHLGNTSEIKDTIQGVSGSASLAIDYSVGGIQNPLDDQTIYLQSNEYHAPSPYNKSGKNDMYSQTTNPGSVLNALSDFHGYFNTKEIIKKRGDKNYESWKPTKTVGSDYPAASCCDMYRTEGTKQGDWYLPGAGEIGYLMARKKIIDNSMIKLGKYPINVEKGIWTSTESGESISINVDSVKGMIGSLNKDSSTSHVYSFIQLSEDGKVMNPDNIGNISTILFINNLNFSVELSKDGISYEKLKEGNNIVYGKIGEKLFYKFYKSGYESQEGVISVDSSFKYVNIELIHVTYQVTIKVTPSDSSVTYSIDSKDYNNSYTNGEKIDVPYGSALNYKIQKEKYETVISSSIITSDTDITETLNPKIPTNLRKSGNLGDIVIYNSIDNGFCSPDELSSLFNDYLPEYIIPIGVVAIPSSHDIYGDKSSGVVSLEESELTSFGSQLSDYLTKYNSVVKIGGDDGNLNNGVAQGYDSSANLPTDGYSKATGPMSLDNVSRYRQVESIRYAPSPYNSDGSRNPVYSQSPGVGSPSNYLSSLDGSLNTEKLIDVNSNAAIWAHDYVDESKQSGWFLPTAGEIGYLYNRVKLIDESISKINEVYSKSYPLVSGIGYYWTSTQSDFIVLQKNTIYCCDFSESLTGINYFTISTSCKVRPFKKV